MSNFGSLVLALDITSRNGSVAIARDGVIVAEVGTFSEERQSAVLWSDIDLLLVRVGASLSDVDAFAVCRGPGAFTGVRVGIAAAAGLARATNRPLYGATSLELTARSGGASDLTVTVLNAYKKEVYAQQFQVLPDGLTTALARPWVGDPARLFGETEMVDVRFAGSGAYAYGTELTRVASDRAISLTWARVAGTDVRGWVVGPPTPFLASTLAVLASEQLAAGLEPIPIEPCYVRQSEAEINLLAGRLGGASVTRVG